MHRVEVACPIYDRDIKSWINAYLAKIFQDNTKARSIQPDGTYTFVREGWDAAELDIPDAPFCLHNWCIEHPLQDVSIYEKKEPVQQDERIFLAEKQKALRLHAEVMPAFVEEVFEQYGAFALNPRLRLWPEIRVQVVHDARPEVFF